MKLTTFYIGLLMTLINVNGNSCYGQISSTPKIPHATSKEVLHKPTLVNSDEVIINVVKKNEKNQNFNVKNTQKFQRISNQTSQLQNIKHTHLMRSTAEDKLFNKYYEKDGYHEFHTKKLINPNHKNHKKNKKGIK